MVEIAVLLGAQRDKAKAELEFVVQLESSIADVRIVGLCV